MSKFKFILQLKNHILLLTYNIRTLISVTTECTTNGFNPILFVEAGHKWY